MRRLGLAGRRGLAAGLEAVDLDFIRFGLFGPHAATAVRVPAVKSDQVLALVRDVLC